MRHRPVQSVLLALAAAEGGVRLLSPREQPIEPAKVDLTRYFSKAEIRRGARFARPQLALAMARAGIELGCLILLVRRPPGRLTKTFKRRPVVGGAATAAGLAVALSLPPLPLRAISRKRGIAVGLVTQSWRGWAADLLKSAAIETVLSAGAGAGAGFASSAQALAPAADMNIARANAKALRIVLSPLPFCYWA